MPATHDPLIFGDVFRPLASLDHALSLRDDDPDALGAQQLIDIAPLPDVEAMVSQRERAVVGFMSNLPARQRELLHLVYWHGLTQREAASLCGISESAASQSIARALKRGEADLSEFRNCCSLH